MSLSLDVGGMTFRSTREDDSLVWRSCHLRAGDQVTIRVVEAASADRPSRRERTKIAPHREVVLSALRSIEEFVGSVPVRGGKALEREVRAITQKYKRLIE